MVFQVRNKGGLFWKWIIIISVDFGWPVIIKDQIIWISFESSQSLKDYVSGACEYKEFVASSIDWLTFADF